MFLKSAKLFSRFAILCALALLASLPARAADFMVNGEHAMMTPTGSGGIFLVIHNKSGKDDQLLAAEVKEAKKTEIHRTEMKDGMMKMMAMGHLDVPAGKQVHMKRGGYHVMMFGLDKNLKVGDQLHLTLTFRDAGEIVIKPIIRPMGPMMQHGQQGEQDNQGHMMMKPGDQAPKKKAE